MKRWQWIVFLGLVFVGTVASSFATNDFTIFDITDTTKIIKFDLTAVQTGTIQTLSMPDYGGGTIPLTVGEGNANDLLVSQGTGFAPGWQSLSTAGVAGINITNVWGAKQTFLSTQPYAGNASAPPASGKIAKWDLTGQTADVATSNVANAPGAGEYTVEAILEDTAADITAGIVTVTFSWTDDAGATTDATLTQTLTGTGRSRITIPLYLASGSITFATSHTGVFGTAQYALHIRCAAKG